MIWHTIGFEPRLRISNPTSVTITPRTHTTLEYSTIQYPNSKQLIHSYPGLYTLVNNAGIIRPSPIDWQSTEEMKRVMEVNLWGTVAVTKALLPFLKRHGRSRIVNLSSMAGKTVLLTSQIQFKK